MSIQTTVLDKIAIVDLGFSIWTGAKALEPSDFVNVDVDDLPSSRVASYGRKNLIDKNALQPFKQIRHKAESACARVGTKLLGGYAIPQDSIDQIGKELADLCVEFDSALDTFLSHYDTMVEDWINSNPDMAEPLRRAVLPRAVVKSRFRASFSIFEVNASPRDRTNSMDNVGNDLLDSVLAQVVSAFKTHIESKRGTINDSYRVEVRQTVEDMAAKLERFAFIEPSGGMKILANRLAAAVQGEGKIAGQEFLTLYGLLSPLRSVAQVKRVIEDLAQQGNVSAPTATQQTAAAPAETAAPHQVVQNEQPDLAFEPSQFVEGKPTERHANQTKHDVDQSTDASHQPLDFGGYDDVPDDPTQEVQDDSQSADTNLQDLDFEDTADVSVDPAIAAQSQVEDMPPAEAWDMDFDW